MKEYVPMDINNALATLSETAEVLKKRREKYGDPSQCFSTIAQLWTIAGFSKHDRAVSSDDIPIAMILLKVARNVHGDKSLENDIDIAGYAALMSETYR